MMRSGSNNKRKLRFWTVLAVALFSVIALGCYNIKTGETSIGGAINFKLPAFPETGPHAVVIFSEMAYSPSFRVQEGPRLLPPVGSVPVTGKEVLFTTVEEYKQLSVPPKMFPFGIYTQGLPECISQTGTFCDSWVTRGPSHRT